MLPVNPNVINGLLEPVIREDLLLFGRVGIEPAAEANLLLTRINGISGPPEIELQRFLGELPACAGLIARFECSRWIDELIRIRQSLHINNKIVDPRIDVRPGHDAPYAVVGLVITLGDRHFADVQWAGAARRVASCDQGFEV